jgi:hypothetical protein
MLSIRHLGHNLHWVKGGESGGQVETSSKSEKNGSPLSCVGTPPICHTMGCQNLATTNDKHDDPFDHGSDCHRCRLK